MYVGITSTATSSARRSIHTGEPRWSSGDGTRTEQIHAHRESLEELEAKQGRFQLTLELAARALDGDRAEALRSKSRARSRAS